MRTKNITGQYKITRDDVLKIQEEIRLRNQKEPQLTKKVGRSSIPITHRYSDRINPKRKPTILVNPESKKIFHNGVEVPSDQILNNRSRVRTTEGPRHNQTPIGVKMKSEGPRGAHTTWNDDASETEKNRIDKERLRLFREWQSETGRGQKINEFHRLIVSKNLYLLFHGDEWILEKTEGETRLLSEVFSNKNSALAVYRVGRVEFVPFERWVFKKFGS